MAGRIFINSLLRGVTVKRTTTLSRWRNPSLQILIGTCRIRCHSTPPDPPTGNEDNELNPPEYTSILEETDPINAEETLLVDSDNDIFDKEAIDILNVHNKEWDPRDLLHDWGTDKSWTNFEELEKLPIMHIRCTTNNTYINICDSTGRILTWKSAGSEGYKGCRRGTTFAAQAAGYAAALKARDLGMQKVHVKLRGLGIGRQHSLKGFELGGLQIASIQDVTPVPHNGCKPKKKRRL